MAPLPFPSLRIPLRCWWFVPTFGRAALIRLNTLCKALWLRSRLKLSAADAILVCVHQPEHALARVLARLSGARLVCLVHDEWPAGEDVGPSFRRAAAVWCVSEPLIERVRALGARRVGLLPPIPESALERRPSPEAWKRGTLGVAGSLSEESLSAALSLGLRVVLLGNAAVADQVEARLGCPGLIKRLPFQAGNRDALRLLAEEASVLFVHLPASLASYVANSFPSKLLDFVQTGLPVLIWAPESSPVGRWAKQRDWTLRLTEHATAEQKQAVLNCVQEPEAWARCAAQSEAVARGEFEPGRIQACLEESLRT